MALQWLKGTLAGFREFALAVKNEIVSLQPKDSDTIRWQRDYDGMSAHLNLDAIVGGSSQSPVSDDALSSDTSAPQYLQVKNTGSNDIVKDMPVLIGDKIFGTEMYKGSASNTVFNPVKFYGVATESIAVNEVGMVAISGFYEFSSSTNITNGSELIPNASGTWTATTKGIVKVIATDGSNNTTLVRIIGYKLTEYADYFKIVINNDNTVSIVDGRNPTNTTCGVTDIGNVPKTTIVNPNGNIYLKATYNTDTNSYSFSFVSTITASDTAWLIGSAFTSGVIYQSWQQGAIYFAYRYIV